MSSKTQSDVLFPGRPSRLQVSLTQQQTVYFDLTRPNHPTLPPTSSITMGPKRKPDTTPPREPSPDQSESSESGNDDWTLAPIHPRARTWGPLGKRFKPEVVEEGSTTAEVSVKFYARILTLH